MDIETLEKLAEELGLDRDALYDDIITEAEGIGAGITNSGLSEQIEFLAVQWGGIEIVEKRIRELAS
jgi:hypothetical protein